MLMESGVNTGIMGCCCQKEDALFWKNRHIDTMKQLVQVRQENFELRKQLAGAKAQCENTVENRQRISELSQTVISLREEAKRRAERYANLAVGRDKLAETVSKMQSKIAKQANEIRRLTEENERLSSKNDELSGRHETQKANIACAMEMWHKYETETETLKKALDLAAKDADANFERGKIKGMQEIWKELADCYDGRPIGENRKIFGYRTVGDMLMNLSPTWFMNKAMEYHERKENEEARDIQIGDEVEIFDQYDHSLSDIGIVIAIDKDNPCFAVIGPKFEGCFDETDIQAGNVEKTGQHFDSIPLDYLA